MACNSHICGICDSRHTSKPSTAWCFECNEGLCKECKEHHVQNRASKSHGIIHVNEYQKLPISLLQTAETCKSHSERYLAYCHKHECSCCTECCNEEHKNCKELTNIKDVMCIKSSNSMLEIDNSLRELNEILKKIQKNRAGNLTSLKLNRQKIETEIQIARHTINEHFDCLERELLKELQTIENAERKKISKILASIERKEKEIDELKISLAIIKQHASDLQTFLVSKQIENELVDTDSLLQSMQYNNELSDVIISLKTADLIKRVNGNISRFGEIVVQTSQSDMPLVREKMQQTQAKVAYVTKGSADHQYETIKNKEDPCFIVTVKPGEDALKFGLNGQYRLYVKLSGFILEDIKKTTVQCCWSFDIIRKFGKTGIEKEFAITVGRRNVLGEGTVAFLCSSSDDPGKISRLARIIIKRMQSEVKH